MNKIYKVVWSKGKELLCCRFRTSKTEYAEYP